MSEEPDEDEFSDDPDNLYEAARDLYGACWVALRRLVEIDPLGENSNAIKALREAIDRADGQRSSE